LPPSSENPRCPVCNNRFVVYWAATVNTEKYYSEFWCRTCQFWIRILKNREQANELLGKMLKNEQGNAKDKSNLREPG